MEDQIKVVRRRKPKSIITLESGPDTYVPVKLVKLTWQDVARARVALLGGLFGSEQDIYQMEADLLNKALEVKP